MEDREAPEIWRLSVLLLFYWVVNCPTMNGPHIDPSLNSTDIHRADTIIFAKVTWLSLGIRDPCKYSDTTSLTVTLGLINLYHSCISKIKKIIFYHKMWTSSHRCTSETAVTACKVLTAPQPFLTSESWEEIGWKYFIPPSAQSNGWRN